MPARQDRRADNADRVPGGRPDASDADVQVEESSCSVWKEVSNSIPIL